MKQQYSLFEIGSQLLQMETIHSQRKLITRCPSQETLLPSQQPNPRSSSLNHHRIRPLSPLEPRNSIQLKNKGHQRKNSQFFNGLAHRKNSEKYPQMHQQPYRNVLPKDLKIIYYGPIKRQSQKRRRKISLSPTPKKQDDSLIDRLEIYSRYYDENKTKLSELQKKCNFTFMKMEEEKPKHTEFQGSKTYKKQWVIYGLLVTFSVFLFFKMIL